MIVEDLIDWLMRLAREGAKSPVEIKFPTQTFLWLAHECNVRQDGEKVRPLVRSLRLGITQDWANSKAQPTPKPITVQVGSSFTIQGPQGAVLITEIP